MECSLCGNIAIHPSVSRYNLRDQVCKGCAYAEKMLHIESYCVNAEGKTPEECRIDEEVWRMKVLETRKNTDRFIYNPKDLKKEKPL